MCGAGVLWAVVLGVVVEVCGFCEGGSEGRRRIQRGEGVGSRRVRHFRWRQVLSEGAPHGGLTRTLKQGVSGEEHAREVGGQPRTSEMILAGSVGR